MSVVHFFTPENRLHKIITAVGGKRVSSALEDADAQLAQASDDCLRQIDEALDTLYRLDGDLPAGERLTGAYRTVREIAGLAGMCGLTDLGAAALAFCGLLDQAQYKGGLKAEHKAVPLNVFRVLRRSEMFSDAERAEVLANLDLMIGKLSGKASEAAPLAQT